MTRKLKKTLDSFGLTKENLTDGEILIIEKELRENGKSATLTSIISGMSSHDVSKFCNPNKGGFRYDYLVVGAGLFGATFANIAHRHGKRVLVVDKRPYIGGNCHSERIDGIEVHTYGPHIFHTDSERVWKYINQFARFNNFINRPLANYKGRLYSLPVNMFTLNQMWGVTEPQKGWDMVMRKQKHYGLRRAENAEEMGLARFGRKIFNRLIKGYTEKQWGRKCSELPADILSRLPFRVTYNGNYFNDIHQGIPTCGYTKMIEKMLRGTEVRLNTNYLAHREELDALAEKIVYTGPLDELMDYSLGPLEYRSLRFETETHKWQYYQGNAVINYTERKVPYTRIIEHKLFAPEDKRVQGLNHSVITREYPAEWKKGDEPYYPISDEKNIALYGEYRKLVEALPKKHIIGGRLAEYKYYNMDAVIERALEIADFEFGGQE